MPSLQNTLTFCACLLAATPYAQQSFDITLPDVQIIAERVVRGDGDTYGMGDWHCAFNVSLEGPVLKIDGNISFTEKANDFTTIVGELVYGGCAGFEVLAEFFL